MTDERMEGQVSLFDQDSWCGKTSQEPSPVTKGKTSKPSSRKSSESKNRMLPMCLCLIRENGQSPVVSTMRWGDGQLLGVHDAQFWGVPQRRKRIALVADFGGLCAPEVLFVRKGLSRDSAESGTKGEGTSTGTEEGIGETGGAIGFPLGFRPENVRTYEETATTLCNGTRPGFTCGVIATQPTYCLQGNGIDRADTAGCNGRGWTEDVSYTLNTIDRPAVMAAGFDPQMGAKACGIGYEDGLSPTLNAGKIMGVNIYDSSK